MCSETGCRTRRKTLLNQNKSAVSSKTSKTRGMRSYASNTNTSRIKLSTNPSRTKPLVTTPLEPTHLPTP